MSAGGNRRSKYLGFVAHEIKNPLATALWSCDLLKRMNQADRAGPRAEKMVDASLRALRRMRRLVDDYFTIERLGEGGYELQREPIEVRALVDAAIASLAEKEGVGLGGSATDIPAGARLTGDVEMLTRSLRLVLEHMSKGAPAAAQLAITARPLPAGGGEIQVRAADPPEPLVPALPEERPAGDPSGAVLGYALAEAILKAHGGSLSTRDGGLVLSLPTEA
jgi:signal transduction histidine kinase